MLEGPKTILREELSLVDDTFRSMIRNARTHDGFDRPLLGERFDCKQRILLYTVGYGADVVKYDCRISPKPYKEAKISTILSEKSS